ncbi:hypothetical protein LZ30DRAFT_405067 [Colletotrichum cereale]|nr:hypothetical protein LZ30DRAFT_405067 [Colletotrichum cereale]
MLSIANDSNHTSSVCPVSPHGTGRPALGHARHPRPPCVGHACISHPPNQPNQSRTPPWTEELTSLQLPLRRTRFNATARLENRANTTPYLRLRGYEAVFATGLCQLRHPPVPCFRAGPRPQELGSCTRRREHATVHTTHLASSPIARHSAIFPAYYLVKIPTTLVLHHARHRVVGYSRNQPQTII